MLLLPTGNWSDLFLLHELTAVQEKTAERKGLVCVRSELRNVISAAVRYYQFACKDTISDMS